METFQQNPAKFVLEKADGTVDKGISHEEISSGRRHDHSTPDGTSERVDLPITGMTCAACANRIEKQLKKQTGVETCSVNFATAKATVNYDPQKTNIPKL